jgi:DNA-binding beta-propeller fold protein YncE
MTRYAEGPPRLVPGFVDLQRMTSLLLAERAPNNARVLILGAGRGLELKAFTEAHSGWSFDGKADKQGFAVRSDSNKMERVNLTEDKPVLPRITVGTAPAAVAITPDGKLAYVSDYYSNTVTALSLGAQ